MTRHIILLALLLTSCGLDMPCARYDADAMSEERAMLNDLATVFVDLGYGEPCCPVHFCRENEPCQDLVKYCGMAHLRGGECVEIFVDAARYYCINPARTSAHEWLHAIGYMHGAAMDRAQDEILNEYERRNP